MEYSIFYTPAQPLRSSRPEGRLSTRQESRVKALACGQRVSAEASCIGPRTPARHIETDARGPIQFRLRLNFPFIISLSLTFFPRLAMTFCRQHRNDARCSGYDSVALGRRTLVKCLEADTSEPPAAAVVVASQKCSSDTIHRTPKKKKRKTMIAREARNQRGDICEERSGRIVWRQFSRKCHTTGGCDCQHAIPISRQAFQMDGGRIHFLAPPCIVNKSRSIYYTIVQDEQRTRGQKFRRSYELLQLRLLQ